MGVAVPPKTASFHLMLPILVVVCAAVVATLVRADDSELANLSRLRMFVDDLPDMPRIKGYRQINNSFAAPNSFRIAMFKKKWKFHRDLPATPVFAYGTSKRAATVPGPTIEALAGITTHVLWKNRLPANHILTWDRTIPTAEAPKDIGVPTVVHLHGGIDEPSSDGNSLAWFTKRFQQKGTQWSKKTYRYHNRQQPGTLWYHDHAMGLTRVNILAGLFGVYILRNPKVEAPLGLPGTHVFDRPLVVFDRSFRRDGSIYINATGNNPDIHPHWQPEYFGDAIIVNGKAWPRLVVRRRKYRFRILNASNARFFNFFFTNGLRFVHVGSDSVYLERPVTTNSTLLAPSEIADVIVDFSESHTRTAILANDAVYPYPSGDPVNEENSRVMKFIIKDRRERRMGRVPERLIKYPVPQVYSASRVRHIALFEYTSSTDEPTHLYINAKSFEDPATETPRVGTTEVWDVINLTDDNHPLHVHLGLFVVVKQVQLLNKDELLACMLKLNDAIGCHVDRYARGDTSPVLAHEKGWKNVYKMQPGYLTRILVKFSPIHTNNSYPFDPTQEPGYVYHCHILDHEDNVMMRPLKLIK